MSNKISMRKRTFLTDWSEARVATLGEKIAARNPLLVIEIQKLESERNDITDVAHLLLAEIATLTPDTPSGDRAYLIVCLRSYFRQKAGMTPLY
ncbi:hypothetical protein [Variibacter gotjawalensis]|uniref:hypothetical protein n=1 Tax=Variibacter gotjawalensis TaxID=1333996 RepID=UPI00102B23E4|nr:hypothetical protein [Variibacter gotjawalensis]NIK45881.1 hypothetical protein [Variibacter gotjawalensis]